MYKRTQLSYGAGKRAGIMDGVLSKSAVSRHPGPSAIRLRKNIYRLGRVHIVGRKTSPFSWRQWRYGYALGQSILRRIRSRTKTSSLDGVYSRHEWVRALIALSQSWGRALPFGRLSLLGTFFLGMGSMTLMHHYLGVSARAEEISTSDDPAVEQVQGLVPGIVLGERAVSREYTLLPDDYVLFEGMLADIAEQDRFEERLRKMVEGYPIEGMIPDILKQDRIVAAFLVSIAKKESDWGRRVPVLAGQDCFNYWGYRGIRSRMGTGGHTCFDSYADAVSTVGQRIDTLIEQEKLNTPEKMIIWKCGYSCDGHSRESVRKWIADVSRYYHAVDQEAKL